MKNAILIFLIVILGIVITKFIMSVSYFQIKEIQVEGREKLSEETILEWANIPLYKSIFQLNPEAVKKRISSKPKVKKVIIKRLLPSKVLIHVEERKPYAYLIYKKVLFEVDEDGVVIGKAKKLQDLPEINGVSTLSDEERIKTGIKIVKYAQEVGINFSEVNIENINNILGYLSGGIKVYLGKGTYLEYLSYLPSIFVEKRRIKYVDLRFNRQVVIK